MILRRGKVIRHIHRIRAVSFRLFISLFRTRVVAAIECRVAFHKELLRLRLPPKIRSQEKGDQEADEQGKSSATHHVASLPVSPDQILGSHGSLTSSGLLH